MNYDVDEEMDEDDDIDDVDDVDVDYDEEGSVDTSNTDEDENIVEDEAIVVAAAEAAEGWQGEDDEMDEDEDGEDEDDGDSDDTDDDDDADEEMKWQVSRPPFSPNFLLNFLKDGGGEGAVGANLARDAEDEELDDDALDAMEQAADEIEQEVLSEQEYVYSSALVFSWDDNFRISMADDLNDFDEVGFGEADPENDFEYNANGHRGGASRRNFIFGGGLTGRTRGKSHHNSHFYATLPNASFQVMTRRDNCLAGEDLRMPSL